MVLESPQTIIQYYNYAILNLTLKNSSLGNIHSDPNIYPNDLCSGFLWGSPGRHHNFNYYMNESQWTVSSVRVLIHEFPNFVHNLWYSTGNYSLWMCILHQLLTSLLKNLHSAKSIWISTTDLPNFMQNLIQTYWPKLPANHKNHKILHKWTQVDFLKPIGRLTH